MWKKIKPYIKLLIGPALFVLALVILHHTLKKYHYHDIMHELGQITGREFFLGLVFTFLSYLALTAYDTLALRYIHHPLPYGKTALASFIGYVFSNIAGLISGGIKEIVTK